MDLPTDQAQAFSSLGFAMMVILLLLVNAFFVAVEFAIMSVRRSRIQELLQQGHVAAKIVRELQKDMDTTVAAVQLGITLASLALGWIAEENIRQTVNSVIRTIPATAGFEAPRGLGVVISFLLLSMLHVIVGELIPKSWALRFPEQIILLLVWPFKLFCTVTRPLIAFMNFIATASLRIFGVSRAGEDAHTIGSAEEFVILFEQSRTAGHLIEEEHELLNRALELRQLTVVQLMVPRAQIEWVDVNAPSEAILAQLVTGKHSRFPVAEGDLDHLLGYIRSRDVLAKALRNEPPDLRASLLKPVFVPPNRNALLALEAFQSEGETLGIVLDEFGGVHGLFTLNDIVAVAFGGLAAIIEPLEQEQYTKLADNEWMVEGLMPIEDFRALVAEPDLVMPERGYKTVAGLLLGYLQRIPQVGETVEKGDFVFKVVEMERFRVAKLRVKKKTSPSSGDCLRLAG